MSIMSWSPGTFLRVVQLPPLCSSVLKPNLENKKVDINYTKPDFSAN